MLKKFVKDRAHNRYPAYCCDDIDVRVGALEEAVAALTAGTVPDGAVTLAKLADDARTYAREINKGTLICEWIGTQEEYDAHIAENGGKPLANVRYTITDRKFFQKLEKVNDVFAATKTGLYFCHVICGNYNEGYRYTSVIVVSDLAKATVGTKSFSEGDTFDCNVWATYKNGEIKADNDSGGNTQISILESVYFMEIQEGALK